MDEYAKVRKKCESARIRSGESREGFIEGFTEVFTAEKWRSEEATSATKARSLSLWDNECDRVPASPQAHSRPDVWLRF